MNLRTLKGADIKEKTILYRSPYDIGVRQTEAGEYVIKDDSRIKATLPTLKYLMENNCRIVILTWVKRPGGKVEESLKTIPHAKALSGLLGKEIKKADDCIGEEVKQQISKLQAGELLMLENTRFHPEENEDNDDFAKKLTEGCDFIVFDGFPQAHRKHSSTTGILRHLDSVAGFYLEKEISSLEKITNNPEKPLTLIIGGIKISDKIDAISNLMDEADFILVGGGAANVFLKAEGKIMGDSYIEDEFTARNGKEKKDWVLYAKEIKERGKEKVQLPLDLIIASSEVGSENIKEVEVTSAQKLVPQGFKALDIGSRTIREFFKIVMPSKTIFWNGPMGLFENRFFAKGTAAIAKSMEIAEATTIIAGGDTIEAAKKYCDIEKITHLSLAGGATLEFIAGKELPVLEMLKK